MATESNDNHKAKEEIEFEELWSLKTSDIYKLALQFFKEKNGGKALVLTYNDRLMLFALIKQVAYGKYNPSLVPENGLFDVIGNNRRHVWESLSDMSKSKAMMEFVKLIHSVCPLFASVVEAHKIEKEEKERRIKEELEERERLVKAKQEEEVRQQQEVVDKYKAKELLIRNALNQQTYQQFLAYAQNQYPFDKAQQEILISQLQEQHFNQYVQQAYNHQQQQQQPHQQQQHQQQQHQQQQQQHQQQQHQQQQRQERQATFGEPPQMSENSSTNHLPSNLQPSNGSIPVVKDCSTTSTLEDEESKHEKVVNAGHFTSEIISKRISENISEHSLGMEAASEWTRKDIRDFKESLKAENEAVIKVGSGELVTIRVPTHQHGTSLFWEFATDGLDIGFGLSFEWFGPEEKQNHEEGKSEEKQVDVIIPITRTQSHVEVQCGSHQYPGTGIYLLMFDNSYSLWRSKSIYYRVFYSQ